LAAFDQGGHSYGFIAVRLPGIKSSRHPSACQLSGIALTDWHWA
jgi:hypothetical protein